MKRFYWHDPRHSARPCRWRANSFEKQRVSLRCVYVWGVSSTVTKHLNNFVWKDSDTSERVARRCDDHCWKIYWARTCILSTDIYNSLGQKINDDEMLISEAALYFEFLCPATHVLEITSGNFWTPKILVECVHATSFFPDYNTFLLNSVNKRKKKEGGRWVLGG